HLPPVLEYPGGVVTRELVAADRGSLIEARRPNRSYDGLVEGLFSNVDAEHEPPTDATLWGWPGDLSNPVQAMRVRDPKGAVMTGFNFGDYALFIGLDVGKSEHHATALTADADKVYDKTLPNSQQKLQHILTELVDQYGPALLVVDRPCTIGALPVAVAQSLDTVEVAYLPGLTMRRGADRHAGSAKTDASDAYIIADTA